MIVYGLVDPETDTIIYIGKTKYTLKKRLGQHKCSSRSYKLPVHLYIQTIGEDNIKIIELDTASSNTELLKKESEWIKKCIPLCNIQHKNWRLLPE